MCVLQNAMFATLRIICGYTRQSERTEFGQNVSFKRPGSIRSLFSITSDSNDQFSFVADEFCELVHASETELA